MLRRQVEPADSLVIYPIASSRLLAWMIFGLGVLAVPTGLLLLVADVWAGAAITLVLGAVLTPIGWRLSRMRVACDRAGIRYYGYRLTVIPTPDIASLHPRPVAGAGRVQRAAIAVTRRDGSEVRLDPTMVVTSEPDHQVLSRRIEGMRKALGLT